MPKIAYVERDFRPAALKIIEQANSIIATYRAAGYDLTLRQLFYQFVSRGLIPNKVNEYKRLGDIVNDARLAGLIDWSAIVDRTRNLEALAHWGDPSEIVETAARQFRIDKWARQAHRVEVWIEKDALSGVFERICQELDVPFLSCRGYTSQSEMWGASQRLLRFVRDGQKPVILHFGDHDPSGIDMSRDIEDRLRLFMGRAPIFRRVALNFDQVEEYNPPPNPAKWTDSRASGYVDLHGDESWELDALEPTVLADLVRTNVADFRDEPLWRDAVKEEEAHRRILTAISEQYEDVADFVDPRARSADDEDDDEDE